MQASAAAESAVTKCAIKISQESFDLSYLLPKVTKIQLHQYSSSLWVLYNSSKKKSMVNHTCPRGCEPEPVSEGPKPIFGCFQPNYLRTVWVTVTKDTNFCTMVLYYSVLLKHFGSYGRRHSSEYIDCLQTKNCALRYAYTQKARTVSTVVLSSERLPSTFDSTFVLITSLTCGAVLITKYT